MSKMYARLTGPAELLERVEGDTAGGAVLGLSPMGPVQVAPNVPGVLTVDSVWVEGEYRGAGRSEAEIIREVARSIVSLTGDESAQKQCAVVEAYLL